MPIFCNKQKEAKSLILSKKCSFSQLENRQFVLVKSKTQRGEHDLVENILGKSACYRNSILVKAKVKGGGAELSRTAARSGGGVLRSEASYGSEEQPLA